MAEFNKDIQNLLNFWHKRIQGVDRRKSPTNTPQTHMKQDDVTRHIDILTNQEEGGSSLQDRLAFYKSIHEKLLQEEQN